MAERGRLLVLLDSVERLVEVVGAQVARWRRLAPQVHFLVTSHVPLGLDWEQRFPLEPLPLPSSVEDMDDNPCVRLFVDRARQVQPGFDPDTTQAAALVELIARLDGLPLAIELAAGRSHLLAPDDLLDRLDQRFRLLRRSQGYGAGRHGTLQAALDWAWEMLQPWEQAALAQCSVFRGGFDWAAVEAVIRLDDVRDAPWSGAPEPL